MRRLYSLIFALALPLILLRLCWQGWRNPAYRDRWPQRLGLYGRGRPPESPLWIHAVSVGEVGAAAPLIRALRERYPYRNILVTTSTPTGYATVARQFGETVHHAYFPYDLLPIVGRFLRHFRPRMLLLMETELWPNVIHACHAAQIPVLLVNGRMSERSARRYLAFRGLCAGMLHQVSRIAAQSEADAARLVSLGAESARVRVTGSLKFDVHLPSSVFEEGASIRRELGANRARCGFSKGASSKRHDDAYRLGRPGLRLCRPGQSNTGKRYASGHDTAPQQRVQAVHRSLLHAMTSTAETMTGLRHAAPPTKS